MARLEHQTYESRVMIAMTVYVVVLLSVWPLAKGATEALPKIGFALAPVVPLLYVIWLMAQKVLASDELEQRTHLIGIGVAAAVVSIVSIISGFLAAANVLTLESTSVVLMWIFPLLMLTYSMARGRAARRYGSSACDEEERMPLYLRLLWAAALIGVAAVYLQFRGADAAGILFGMAIALLGASAVFALRRWRRRRTPGE